MAKILTKQSKVDVDSAHNALKGQGWLSAGFSDKGKHFNHPNHGELFISHDPSAYWEHKYKDKTVKAGFGFKELNEYIPSIPRTVSLYR